jgi:hypothetical protein
MSELDKYNDPLDKLIVVAMRTKNFSDEEIIDTIEGGAWYYEPEPMKESMNEFIKFILREIESGPLTKEEREILDRGELLGGEE